MLSSRRASLAWLMHGLGALALAALLVAKAVRRPLSPDEHQFVAPAVLWWREGLLPYLDFPHFHAPYTVFVNALPVALTDHLLLGVRLLSVLCALSFLYLLHRAMTNAARRAGWQHGRWLAGAALLLAVAQPLFAYTSSLAWNHDNSLLAAFAGLLVAGAALRRGACGRRLVLAGVLFAVSAGLRFSMAPLGLCLVIGVGLCADPKHRTRAVSLAVLGGVLGSLPFLANVLLAPSAAWFGNFEYAALNTAFREQQGFDIAMDLPSKLRWMKEMPLSEPGAIALQVLCALALLRLGWNGVRKARQQQPELVIGLVCLPGLLLGTLAATPTWPQYLFAMTLWLVPLAGWALVLHRENNVTRWLMPAAALFAVVCAGPAWDEQLNHPARAGQGALDVHAAGLELGALVGDGRVLTRAPILPLEGGARIDPAMAGGPYAWRIAPLMEPSARANLGILGPSNVAEHLQRQPVDALLLINDDAQTKLDEALNLETWLAPELPLGAHFGLQLRTPPLNGDR